ncbi:hypothetical protein [Streptomyces sp. NPDC060031]|uniref:hypothetical protein n=1 Tax=Streptomyces sp. NPDC060031 TaxID=3347043 RepID=UPI00367B7188
MSQTFSAARNSPIGRRFLTAYATFTNQRLALTGLSLLRIGYGVTLLCVLLTNLGVRDELWGPDGLYPWSDFTDPTAEHAFSLYALSSSVWWSEALYFGLLGLTVLFTLGWRTRLVTPALWVSVWSWQERNPVPSRRRRQPDAHRAHLPVLRPRLRPVLPGCPAPGTQDRAEILERRGALPYRFGLP